MPRKKFNSESEDDEFETEAFQFMNKGNEIQTNEEVDLGSDSHDDEDDDSDDDKNDDEHYKAQDDVDGSDDEAPESVGFSDSRTTVLAQLRSAMKQVDDEKQKLKDKRKKKQVMFKEQKEKKMKYTEQEKLPGDILESIDDVIPKNNKHKKKLLKQQKSKKQKNKDLTKNNVQPEQEKKGQKFRSHPVGSLRDDYIPLVDEASGVTVTEVRQFEKQQESLAQKAADFRNSRLNSSDIPRESNRARLLKLEKKRQRLMS